MAESLAGLLFLLELLWSGTSIDSCFMGGGLLVPFKVLVAPGPLLAPALAAPLALPSKGYRTRPTMQLSWPLPRQHFSTMRQSCLDTISCFVLLNEYMDCSAKFSNLKYGKSKSLLSVNFRRTYLRYASCKSASSSRQAI